MSATRPGWLAPRCRHRRHLHRPRLGGRRDRRGARRQAPHHAQGPRAGRRAGRAPPARRGGRGARGRAHAHPRHHAGHQCADRAQGRPHRAAHDGGLSRRPRDRPRGPLRHVRPLHRSAGAARPAPPAPRGRRAAATPTGACCTPLDVASARAAIGRAARAGRRGGRDLPAARVPQPRSTSEPSRGLVAEMAPGLPVSRSSEVVPEIREYERTSTTVGQRLRDAAHGPLPRRSRAEDREHGHPRRLLHHAVVRRHRHAGHGQARAGAARRVGSGRGRPRRGPRWRARRARIACSRSTWAAPPRRPASSTAASRCSRASSRWRGRTASRRARACPSACPSSS